MLEPGPPVGMPGMKTQKQCIDVKIMLDERMDGEITDLLKGFLEGSVVGTHKLEGSAFF